VLTLTEALAAVVEEFKETLKNRWEKRVSRFLDSLPRWLQAAGPWGE